jgi:acyl-coenzyme A synthetase/AMP-(fatty) acid ligase
MSDMVNGGISAWLSSSAPGLVALRSAGDEVTFSELAESVARAETVASGSGANGIICNSGLGLREMIIWAMVAQKMGLPCVLGGGVLSNEKLFGLTPDNPFSHFCDGKVLHQRRETEVPYRALHTFDRDAVVLLTSGTTGEPKLAVQTWHGIMSSVRRGSSLKQRKWLLTYSPTRFAGIQVWLHALANEGTLLFSEQLNVNVLIELMLTHHPDMVSATPTFWRQVLRSISPERLADFCPRTITLGGEAADKTLLETLRHLFPKPRIVQIYASTEAGVGVIVDDGEEGLPASILEHGYEGNEFKILDEELFIKSKANMQGYVSQSAKVVNDDGFVATGDVVKLSENRILFHGRKDGRFNVGGHKVDPTEIERQAMTVTGVALAQAFARKSPVLGQIPALRFIALPGYSSLDLKKQLEQAFKNFPPYKIPRLIEPVSDLETTDTGKIKRAL